MPKLHPLLKNTTPEPYNQYDLFYRLIQIGLECSSFHPNPLDPDGREDFQTRELHRAVDTGKLIVVINAEEHQCVLIQK